MQYLSNADLIHRQIADTDVLISIGENVADFNGCITLNETCAFVWELLQSPQTPETLAKDMIFMQEFDPQMVGIGPFLPHQDTPFREESAGSVELTLFVLALTRIMLPHALMPSTTALGTAEADGRKMGVLAGCNVVMPNLSPADVRKKYMLYDNKAGTDLTAQEGIALLRQQMEEIGYEVVIGRGDFRKENVEC